MCELRDFQRLQKRGEPCSGAQWIKPRVGCNLPKSRIFDLQGPIERSECRIRLAELRVDLSLLSSLAAPRRWNSR